VDGGDGGGIERRQGVGEAPAALGEFLGGAGQQPREYLVGAHQCGIVEGGDGVGDLAAHAVAQFLGGCPAEGDQQHLVEGGRALGEVAGDQGRQREGLAGASAGLQHRRRTGRRQRAEQIEVSDRGAHGSSRSDRSSGCQSRALKAPNRWSSPGSSSPGRSGCISFSSGTRPPQARTWAGWAFSPPGLLSL